MRWVFALILLSLLVASCKIDNDAAYIHKEIDSANYCDVNEDCVYAGGKCPFGCYVYVNNNEAQRIRGLLESYTSNCEYGCLACQGAVCNNSKCEPVCN